MKDRNYVISRDNVYAGRLLHAKGMYETYDHSRIYPMNFNICRSTLFVINKDKKSSDLLYESGNYPILNISDNQEVKNSILGSKDGAFVIDSAMNISELLAYYGYDEKLTYHELINARNNIFSYFFLIQNSMDFGQYYNALKFYPVFEDAPNAIYFDTVFNLRDQSFDGTDNFKPSKEEGHIRSLKR